MRDKRSYNSETTKLWVMKPIQGQNADEETRYEKPIALYLNFGFTARSGYSSVSDAVTLPQSEEYGAFPPRQAKLYANRFVPELITGALVFADTHPEFGKVKFENAGAKVLKVKYTNGTFAEYGDNVPCYIVNSMQFTNGEQCEWTLNMGFKESLIAVVG